MIYIIQLEYFTSTAVELVGPSRRMLGGMIIQLAYSVGISLLAVVAYFVRDWRTLQLVTSAPGFIILLYYWFVLPRIHKEQECATPPAVTLQDI